VPRASARSDLHVSVRAPASIGEAEPLSFKVRVANRGPQAAPGVRPRFTLPRATDVRVRVPRGLACTGRPVVTCDGGRLASGRAVGARIMARPTEIRTRAVVAAASTQSLDTHPRDNRAAALTRVRVQATLCGDPTAGARARIAC
jgi:hypothetical protein